VTFSNLYARRSMSYTSTLGAIASDPVLGSFLIEKYTSSFSQKLSTRVVSSGVVNVPRPAGGPLLWVNAQYGVSGGPVADWTDLSGSGHDLVQAAAPNRPVMQPSGFAPNVATVHFDGATSLLHSSGALAFDEFTYMLTFQTPLLSTAGMLLERSVDASANSGERLYQSAAPTHSILARRAGVVHSGDAAANWAVDGNWHVATFVYSRAGGGKLVLDGAPLATFAGLAAQAVSDTLYVGSNQALTLPFLGPIRELMVFASALTDPQIETLAEYMGPQVGLVH
jgi:hypothetical protein